ncbi:MAG: hypothetical protein NTW49_10375 [Bacteroidia bacterium]|nr:hypothetical protein [Bacteroidia bacterium]
MNFKLIFLLSLFGLFMGIATVYFIPAGIEPVIWLVIFAFCAYIIAKKCDGKLFLHGFVTSLFNCVWITAFHLMFFDSYLVNHQAEARMMVSMPKGIDPKYFMLVTGIFIGIVSGLVLGLFSYLMGKIVTKSDSKTNIIE